MQCLTHHSLLHAYTIKCTLIIELELLRARSKRYETTSNEMRMAISLVSMLQSLEVPSDEAIKEAKSKYSLIFYIYEFYL